MPYLRQLASGECIPWNDTLAANETDYQPWVGPLPWEEGYAPVMSDSMAELVQAIPSVVSRRPRRVKALEELPAQMPGSTSGINEALARLDGATVSPVADAILK
jgi:hypothetical protein